MHGRINYLFSSKTESSELETISKNNNNTKTFFLLTKILILIKIFKLKKIKISKVIMVLNYFFFIKNIYILKLKKLSIG